MAALKKNIYNLGFLSDNLKAANKRYLEFISAFNNRDVGRKRLEKVTESKTENNRNYKGFNFFSDEDLLVLLSIVRGEFNISGFRNKNLQKQLGFNVSHKLVGEILKEEGFGIQANRKTDEGKSHPDRNAQFVYIHLKVKDFQEKGQPVISVDAKKKELVGNFKNNGKEWHKEKEPDKAKVYDFLSDAEGKAMPYGVYDLSQNKGWVSVGIGHDTAEFAIETIKKWWAKMGSCTYPNAQRLLITVDGGGSNSSRSRLGKKGIQNLSDETGLVIDVCHFPPATSKWNKIGHRLFSYISQNCRGKPSIGEL